MANFFKGAWGTVELWIAVIATTESRDLAIQKYESGDQANVQNKGDDVKIARCDLLFDEFEGQKEGGRERLLSLVELKGLGKPQLFTHPLYGTYLAEIEQFEHRISADGTITGSATFVPTEDVGAVVVDPLGVSLDVDTGALDAARLELLQQLEDADPALLGLATLPAALSDAGEIFAAASSARDVLVGLSDVTERAAQEIDDLELAADVALWPVLKAYVLASEAATEAAKAASGDEGDLMTLRVDTPISMRRLCAELYGAADAEAAYQDALSMNDVRTPARVPTGTQLKLRKPAQAKLLKAA